MNKAGSYYCRWIYFFVVLAAIGYLAGRALQRTDWYRDRLYTQLVTGDHHQRTRAATALAQLGGQEELLDALKVEGEAVREIARQNLEYLWFNAAGKEAFRLTHAAAQAASSEDFVEALRLLDQVTKSFPHYAEGWNRRASVNWQLGRYTQSIEDCEQALQLNPHHYGAWQGIGICQLELGKVVEACQALREAIKITPYDASTRRSLRRCESLLRIYPHPAKATLAGTLL